MKQSLFLLVVLIGVAMLSDKAQMANFSSVRSGDWSDPLTWGNSPTGPIPGSGDFVTVSSGTTVSFMSETTAELNGIVIRAGGVLSLTKALNCGVGSGDFSNAGTISGDNPLRAQGANQFFFAQTGVFTAPLEVFQSSTIVNGPIDGAVTVMSGGTLKGTGPFNGPMTVAAGGTLGGPGVMTVTGDVVLNGALSSPIGCCPGLTFNFSGSVFTNNGSVVAPITLEFNFKGSSQRIDGSGTWRPTSIVVRNGATVSLGNEVTMDPFGFSIEAGGSLSLTHPLNCSVSSGVFSNAGTIVGSQPLRAQGANQFFFAQTGVFSAPFEILQSSTIVNGPVNGVTTVMSGGTLKGTGPFNGPITVATGGTLGGAGVMTVNNSVVLNGKLSSPSGCCPGLTFNFSGPTFTNNGSVIAPISFEFNFLGATQSLSGTGVFIPSTARIHSGSTLTLGSNHQMNSITIDAGGTMNITGRTLSLLDHEPITNNGTIITTGSTIVFNGPSYQHLGLTANIIYNNLTINNPDVLLSGDVTVTGTLALNIGDLMANGGTRTLTMPASASSTGTGDVLARVKRTGFTLGTPLSFGNPNNTIRFDSGPVPGDVTVELAKQAPSSFPTAIKRAYSIAATGSGYSATLRLHYQEADLNGNQETTLGLWRFEGSNWASQGRTAFNSTSNWVERAGVTDFSLWTLASADLPADMVITYLTPDKGGDSGSVSSIIYGRGFEQGASARLVRAGYADIVGSPTSAGNDGRTLATSFDLTGKALGLWDVLVTNPDRTSVTLPQGFTVEKGRAAQLWVDVVGRDQIRAGRRQSFNISYGNRGNMNAYGVPLWIAGIPRDAILDFGFERVPPLAHRPNGQINIDWTQVPTQLETVDNQLVIPLMVPVIPPGVTKVIRIDITIPTERIFKIRAAMNKPFFQSPLTPAWANCLSAFAENFRNRLPPVLDCQLAIVELNEADFAEPQSVLFLTDFLAAYLNLVVQCGGDYTSALLVETGVGPVAAQAVEFWLDVPLSLYSSLRDDRCTDAFQLTWEAIKDNIIVSQSYDPNDKVGSSGVGVLRSVSGQNPLQYSIHVENVETATAPAQEVVVTDQLDVAKTDLHTFSFEQIYFGNNRLSPSAGSRAFSADVDLRPNNNLIVRVDARLNLETGLVTWRFTSIDPATGLPTDDPVAGFLPPNITPPQGEGIVLFTVMPKQGLSTGTEIRNRARIVFDANAPIDTPEWFNTIDNAKPTSQVLPLSANQCTSFQVGWSGTDIGSGILDYTVFVSENGGPFTVWLLHTTATLGTFAGQSSKSYSFYTVARDRTGNIEDPPTIADANARVNDIQVPVITSAVVDKPSLWPLNHRMIDVAVNYDVTDNCDSSSGITCALTVTSNEPINGTGDGDISPDWEIVGAHHVRLRAERAGNGNGRIYTITITCTDSRGNSSMKTVTVRVPKNQS